MSQPYSCSGSTSYWYTVCSVFVAVKEELQHLAEVRVHNALRNAPLKWLQLKIRLQTISTVLHRVTSHTHTDDHDSDTTIIYQQPSPDYRTLVTIDSDETALSYDSDETVLPCDSDETVLPYDSDETVLPYDSDETVYLPLNKEIALWV